MWIWRSDLRTGTYGGARIRSDGSNRRLRGESGLDLVRIAITRMPPDSRRTIQKRSGIPTGDSGYLGIPVEAADMA